jgi:hypothetical protein
MKKLINLSLLLPLLNIIFIYSFALICILFYGFPEFYSINPNSTILSFVYEPITVFSMITVIVFIPIGFLFIIYNQIKAKKYILKLNFITYFLGIILTLIAYFADFKGILFWFFD